MSDITIFTQIGKITIRRAQLGTEVGHIPQRQEELDMVFKDIEVGTLFPLQSVEYLKWRQFQVNEELVHVSQISSDHVAYVSENEDSWRAIGAVHTMVMCTPKLVGLTS